MLHESAPDPGLTVKESLPLYAGYHAQAMDADDVLALVGLDAQGAVTATKLLGGQRQRLDFGLALIGNPDLIFLDEPTTGFDPAARRVAWDVISSLGSLGKTILLTTHYMEEAEVLADRIAVIVSGRILAEGRAGNPGRPGSPSLSHARRLNRNREPMRTTDAHHHAPSALSLIVHQCRSELRSFRRDRQVGVTTVVMPLVLLVAFVGLAGDHTSLVQNGRQISVAGSKRPSHDVGHLSRAIRD